MAPDSGLWWKFKIITILGLFSNQSVAQEIYPGPRFNSNSDAFANLSTSTLNAYADLPIGLVLSSPVTTVPLASSQLDILRKKIAQELETTPEAQWGIEVVSLDRGDKIFTHNEHKFFRPASTMKVLTTAFALNRLGLDFQFKTSLFPVLGQSTDATTSFLLQADGDPGLYGEQAIKFFDQLAEQIEYERPGAAKIVIYLDEGLYDRELYQPRWMLEDFGDCFGSPVAPFQVHLNCQKGIFSLQSNGQPQVTLDRYQTLEGAFRFEWNVQKTNSHAENKISFFSPPLSSIIFGSGKAVVGSKIPVAFPIPDAVDYYGKVMERELLLRLGKSFGKTIEVRRGVIFSAKNIGNEIWSYSSGGMDDIVSVLLKESQNLMAESFLLRGALKEGQRGLTRLQAIEELKKYLTGLGIDTGPMGLEDGSGVSHYNYIRPHDLITVLTSIHKTPEVFSEYYEWLPIAGVDGTLASRMNSGAAFKNVHAKTGTMTRVSSLAGFVKTADGETLVFALMANNFVGGSSVARNIQDKICQLLASSRR